MKYAALSLLALAACASAPAPAAPVITEADTALILGEGWTGTLTYRDYSPPYDLVTLRTTLEVTRTASGLDLFLRYPDEPKADGSSALEISTDGRLIDGDPIISRSKTGGQLVFVTEGACEDDDRPATCRHTYSLSETQFGMAKSVDFGDAEPAVERNAYTFTRS
jgi:hypothetical protein